MIRFWALLFGLTIALFNVQAQTSLASHDDVDRQASRHFELAESYQASSDPRAEKEYLRAISLKKGKYPAAWANLVQLYEGSMRFSEAIDALNRYIVQTPEIDHQPDRDKLDLLKRANALQRDVRSNKAVTPTEYVEYSRILIQFDLSNKALEVLETCLERNPNSVEANLALVSAPIFPMSRRVEAMNRALALGSGRANVHSAAGWFYLFGTGKVDDAITQFRIALDLDERRAEAWQGLGHAFKLRSRREEAIVAFENYLRYRKNPNSYDNYIRGVIKDLKGEPEQ